MFWQRHTFMRRRIMKLQVEAICERFDDVSQPVKLRKLRMTVLRSLAATILEDFRNDVIQWKAKQRSVAVILLDDDQNDAKLRKTERRSLVIVLLEEMFSETEKTMT